VIPFGKTDHAAGGRALEIRDDLSASELRALAARETKNRAARRMLAIANALEGMSRAAAARAAGMDRQALRDAVVRYNAEGLDVLYDRSTPGRPPALTEAELALLSARIFRGPDPETDGVSSWTLPDLCRWIEDRFDKRLPRRACRAFSDGRVSRARRRARPTRRRTLSEPVAERDRVRRRRDRRRRKAGGRRSAVSKKGAPVGAGRRRRGPSRQAGDAVVHGVSRKRSKPSAEAVFPNCPA